MRKPRKLIPINKPILGREELQAATRVLRSGLLTEKTGAGPLTRQFEQEFARFVGAKYAVAVNSGTAALHAAFLALNIGPGTEVIMPSFTFVATAEAAVLAGARPVFVDIDPQTYTLNPDEVRRAITEKTAAIVAVHLYGHPCDMKPILEIAEKNGLAVIEDAAQAHGAAYRGKPVGSLGDVACFSFYASKNMTTACGEGGMVTTNDKELYERLVQIRNHGEQRAYWSVRLGHNYRMSEIAAAVGLEQLRKLPRFIEARRQNARTLTRLLARYSHLVQIPEVKEGCTHAWYVYTVRLRKARWAKQRDKVVDLLRQRAVGAAVYYATPVHRQPFYRRFRPPNPLRETERAARQVLSLPVHPGLSMQQARYVAQELVKALRRVFR
ncbi:DegT/DnrJ/EryC1/StrS family aminotransferase [archaeon]|nr:DegT/DnrJ/EryC1/StrS family aminotransferase [archaeon]